MNYLQRVGDPGTRLMFKFRSGTNGLNEELGIHRGNLLPRPPPRLYLAAVEKIQFICTR